MPAKESEILETIDELIAEVREKTDSSDDKIYLSGIAQVVHLLKLKMDMLPVPPKQFAPVRGQPVAHAPYSGQQPTRGEQAAELRALQASIGEQLAELEQ